MTRTPPDLPVPAAASGPFEYRQNGAPRLRHLETRRCMPRTRLVFLAPVKRPLLLEQGSFNNREHELTILPGRITVQQVDSWGITFAFSPICCPAPAATATARPVILQSDQSVCSTPSDIRRRATAHVRASERKGETRSFTTSRSPDFTPSRFPDLPLSRVLRRSNAEKRLGHPRRKHHNDLHSRPEQRRSRRV